MRTTITFGPESMPLPVAYVDGQTTVGQVLADANVRAVLGVGDNIAARSNGVLLDPSVTFPAGSVLQLETKANEKGA